MSCPPPSFSCYACIMHATAQNKARARSQAPPRRRRTRPDRPEKKPQNQKENRRGWVRIRDLKHPRIHRISGMGRISSRQLPLPPNPLSKLLTLPVWLPQNIPGIYYVLIAVEVVPLRLGPRNPRPWTWLGPDSDPKHSCQAKLRSKSCEHQVQSVSSKPMNFV